MNNRSIPTTTAPPGDRPVRILFYTHSARAFTSALIGHLQEIAGVFPVVLLAEPLAPRYLSLLNDRALFPRLERIVPVRGLGYTLRELIRNNRRWHSLAHDMVQTYAPSVVVTENDMASLFEMYLLRAAKKKGAATLTIQAMANFKEEDNVAWVELLHLHPQGTRPGRVLKWFRWLRMQIRKEIGHLLVHTLLPWSVGERALRGDSSYIKYRGGSGMRDGDLNLVLTTETHLEFSRRGVPLPKLAVLRHPLGRSIPRQLFFDGSGATAPAGRGKKILVLLGFVTEGFTKDRRLPFSAAARKQMYQDVLRMICRLLPDWQVLLKAHPNWKTPEAVSAFLQPLPAAISILAPLAPVEPLLETCDAILDLPPAGTTVLFTCSLAFPRKPIIAADVLAEFYGDNYRNFAGVDYIDSWTALEQLLRQVQDGSFRKTTPPTGEPIQVVEFPNSVAAIHALLPTGASPAHRRDEQ